MNLLKNTRLNSDVKKINDRDLKNNYSESRSVWSCWRTRILKKSNLKGHAFKNNVGNQWNSSAEEKRILHHPGLTTACLTFLCKNESSTMFLISFLPSKFDYKIISLMHIYIYKINEWNFWLQIFDKKYVKHIYLH